MKLTTKNLCQSRRIIALESPGSRWNYPRWKEREELGNWRLLSSPWPLPGSVVKPAAGCCAHHPQLVKVQEQVAAVSQTCTSNPLLDLRLTTEGSKLKCIAQMESYQHNSDKEQFITHLQSSPHQCIAMSTEMKSK